MTTDVEREMPVYVDDAIWRRWSLRWCHLLADDIDELHRFAAEIGVQRSSYQGPPRTAKPHYDITAFERDRALRLGAVPCTRDAIVSVLRRVRTTHRNPSPPQFGERDASTATRST